MVLSPNPETGSFSFRTAFLGFALFLCVALAGASVYVKFHLDRTEMALSAPSSAFTPDEALYEKTVVALGYSGFLGSAQEYMGKRDRAALGDMRMNYKTAQEAMARIGDKASTPIRRDIKAIMDIFGGILARAEEGGDALSDGITNADLLTATTALNMLDNRLSSALASNRTQAQSAFKYWSLALLVLALGGFALAGILAARALFSTREKYGEDLKTLAQSVSNMVHGDVGKAMWGIERTDEMGELARSIDYARLYFTQLPDVSIMGEDGPVRLRFDGEARSLFQSMMKKITESYERAQQTALGYTGTLNAQQDLLSSLTTRMQASLEDLHRQGKINEETIRMLSGSLAESAKSLVQAQDSGVEQIGKLVPMMQERIQNMAEVTHLAGSQVTQSLQSLIKSESTLRASATQSQQTVSQLSASTNQMGERMFAAINLMQASSKLLNETIDSVKSRFNDAVSTLSNGEKNITQILTRAEQRLEGTVNAEEKLAELASRTATSAEKLEKAVDTISMRHEAISDQVVTAAHRMDAIVATFDSAQRTMTDAAGQMRRDGGLLGNVLAELRANNEQLISSISQNNQTSFNAAQSLAEKSHALMQRLEVQIQQQAQMAEGHIGELSSHGQTMAQQASTVTSSLTQAVTSLKTEQDKLASARLRFTETVTDIGARLEQHATGTFGKTEQWAAQSFSKISSIAEQMEGVLSRLNMLGQLTGTLGTVAGQLGQLVPALTSMGGNLPSVTAAPMAVPMASGEAPIIEIDMEGTKTIIIEQAESIIKELHDQWHKAVIQIEAMHDQLAQIVMQQKDQLETRLVVMDKKLRETADSMANASADMSEEIEAEEKQAEIMNELIAAISKINEHVLEIDDVIDEAGLRKGA